MIPSTTERASAAARASRDLDARIVGMLTEGPMDGPSLLATVGGRPAEVVERVQRLVGRGRVRVTARGFELGSRS